MPTNETSSEPGLKHTTTSDRILTFTSPRAACNDAGLSEVAIYFEIERIVPVQGSLLPQGGAGDMADRQSTGMYLGYSCVNNTWTRPPQTTLFAMLPRKRQRRSAAASTASTASLPTTGTSEASAAASKKPAVAAATSQASQASSMAGADPPAVGSHAMPLPPMPPIPPDQPFKQVCHLVILTLFNSNHFMQVRKAKSWYGQWPRTPSKAAASTSVARENILGDTIRSHAPRTNLSRFDPRKSIGTGSSRSSSRSVSMHKQEEGDKQPVDQPAPPSETEDTTKAATTNDTQVSTPAKDIPKSPVSGPDAAPSWLAWLSTTPAADKTAPSNPPRPVTPAKQTATDAPKEPPPSAPPASTSWFGFWSAADQMKDDGEKDRDMDDASKKDDVVMQDAPAAPQPAPQAGSTWAFWSRETPTKAKTTDSPEEAGEIAVIGEGSESHPKPMVEQDVSGPKDKDAKKDEANRSTWRKKKRVRPPSMEATDSDSAAASRSATPVLDQAPQGLPTPPKDAKPIQTTKTELPTKAEPTNLLLPSFHSTYQMKDNPSIMQQLTQFLLRTSQKPTNHVFRVKEPARISKAIAIGVHGLFPATYLRPMIGQPTGTSLRFATLCAEAIRRWADAHGCSNCEIEKVALEGEGRISDRVDNLWKLMLNWIEHIRKADLIIIACHSQGVPVSVMLLEKLIDLGIITTAKIGVCAMAGVGLGPFPDYKSSILMGSAAELWEFGNPQSANSQRFEVALKRILDHGARVTFIGSIDDQVVPMESAVYSPASHPYIYRAVFIDGRVHAPDFIAHLVGFALKLRNLGVTDHGLVRELSLALAGSLYSGEGHSRLYYDDAVYDLAVVHALETTSTKHPVPCEVLPREGPAPANPYVLPWIMRGMLEEDFVKTELSSETEELLRQFDDWKPVNKALKDVKYRLEAVRSKL